MLSVEHLRSDPTLVSNLRQLRLLISNASDTSMKTEPIAVARPIMPRRAWDPPLRMQPPRPKKLADQPINVWEVLPSITKEQGPLVLRSTDTSNQPRVMPNQLPAGGLSTIASPGPGWLGPFRAMESHQYPRSGIKLLSQGLVTPSSLDLASSPLICSPCVTRRPLGPANV